MTAVDVDLGSALRQYFGLDEFRVGQEPIIRALLARRDALAVMPTGSGKSLIYQLTSQLLPGITIVVSPLIALMQDQVESLQQRGISVRLINSTLSKTEVQAAIDDLKAGKAKLLYVTPERFKNKQFRAQLRGVDVSLFVVDEAHSISEWGHSFRPAYLDLADAIKLLDRPTILAVTATATTWVQREIVERLGMDDPQIMVRGTDRPNLFFEVRSVETESDNQRVLRDLLSPPEGELPDHPWLHERVAAMQGSGIIYTATTNAARETAGWLNEWGISAEYYHGQRKKADRERVQDAFMRGDIRVIVATNAFGLGVDKADVRFVIHRDVPSSLEAYYQEAGRAGRDGEFARCVVIYRTADLGRAAFLSGQGRLTREEVEQAYPALASQTETTIDQLAEATELNTTDLQRLIAILKKQRIISERKGQVRVRRAFTPDDVDLDGEDRREAYERSRVEMMRGYVETEDCRRQYILNYFGEQPEWQRCGKCDNDLPHNSERRVVVQAIEYVESPFTMGALVEHEAWGKGVVQRVTEDSVTVLFNHVGYKTLATDVVQAEGLLKVV